MFNSQQNQQEQTFSSSFFKKRQSFHQKLRSQKYEKYRKTQRLNMLLQEQQKNYQQFIIQTNQITQNQMQQRMKQIIIKGDLTEIIITLQLFHYNLHFDELFTQDIISMLIELIEQNIFKVLTMSLVDLVLYINPQLSIQLVEQTDTIPKIIQNIKSLQQGDVQRYYITELGKIINVYRKQSENKEFMFFDMIIDMIIQQQIQKKLKLILLKTLSLYLNKDNNFPDVIVDCILTIYEQEAINQQDELIMINSFLSISKVIYHHQNINIMTIYRMIKMLIHDRKCLRQSLVENYHNIWMLIGNLIKKCSNYQLYHMQKQQKDYFLENINKQKQSDQYYQSITTTLMNKILTQHDQIFRFQQFSLAYVILLSNMTRYCENDMIMKYFVKYDVWTFLEECMDHLDIEIAVVTLEILINLFKSGYERIGITEYFKNSTKIKYIAEDRHMKEQNPIILQKLNILLENLQQNKA